MGTVRLPVRVHATVKNDLVKTAAPLRLNGALLVCALVNNAGVLIGNL